MYVALFFSNWRPETKKRLLCIIKQGKKTREVTSPGPWPLIVLSKPGARRYLLESSGKIQAKTPQEVKTTPSQEDLDLVKGQRAKIQTTPSRKKSKKWINLPAVRGVKLINLTLWPLLGASVSQVTHTHPRHSPKPPPACGSTP